MRRIHLQDGADPAEWRAAARAALADEIPPEQIAWSVGPDSGGLFGDPTTPISTRISTEHRVPRDFLPLAEAVLAHRDPQRHALLYRLLWRLTHGEPALLQMAGDAELARARNWEKAVKRDAHKMKAFVRFKELPAAAGEEPLFVSWFEPEHDILPRVAGFFARRFTGMHWAILTPLRSVRWDGAALHWAPGATRADVPADDALEDLWRTYYASIFNPARLKVQAMKSEMPVKYWKNLPEARLIPELIRGAQARSEAMIAQAPSLPNQRMRTAKASAPPRELPAGGLDELRAQAHDCRACPLWKPATQTVFGVGPATARIVFVGEQPGDQEDLAGRPFVGPAGQLFDRALAEAGIERGTCYVTNTVKHFKFEPRGKRRLHKRADADEQAACLPWLMGELALIQPEIVVCLGSMAATNLFGRDFKLLAQRGEWQPMAGGVRGFATFHPAYLLRLPDADARDAAYRYFVADLRQLRAAN